MMNYSITLCKIIQYLIMNIYRLYTSCIQGMYIVSDKVSISYYNNSIILTQYFKTNINIYLTFSIQDDAK
jgi:hypothetical protein